ncbi:exopolyphosphatase [mine drainage metagenome]|uniref:Exopolyphosphatase n=1 Tax=mine drainage metagenome TaxID=410659 RepID=A0A1J5P6G6_9ZZZZ
MIGGSGFNPPDQPGDITLQGLRELRRTFVRAGNLNKLRMEGLKPDRVPVAAGGLAIMLGVFEELGIQSMEVTDAALRLGVLYDLLGREQSHDMREVTAQLFIQRYGADPQQAQRVGDLALRLYHQLRPDATESDQRLLRWAASLHEIGLSISHSAYHKHSSYIAANADMPGFSRGEQATLAQLILAHTGKLKKLSAADLDSLDLDAVIALRLAVILTRNRTDVDLDGLRLRYAVPGLSLPGLRPPLQIIAPRAWLKANPLTEYSLQQEAAEWARLNWNVALHSPA